MVPDLTRAELKKIKRGNTDWWINEKSMVGRNGHTYIAYMTDMGEMRVKDIDAKCRGAQSVDVCVCRLNSTYADEHNAPSICVLENGKIIVAYTGHSEKHPLSYRVTTRPYDVTSFGEEKYLDFGGDLTYVQLSENVFRGELWLFCRVDAVTWRFSRSCDEGESWSEPNLILSSDAGGLFYLDVRKQFSANRNEDVKEQWFFAFYGHPLISKDHTVRSGIFDRDGFLCDPDGKRTDVNIIGEYDGKKYDTLIDISAVSAAYSSPDGTTVRLLDVSPTPPLRIGIASFTIDDPQSAEYRVITYRGERGWVLSDCVAKVGEFLAPGQTDGSQTYVGGMAFYYGAGDAGYHNRRDEHAWCDTDRVYLARRAECMKGSRLLESYVSHDNGKTYGLEQCIREIPESGEEQGQIKIWRPIVPIYAGDNLPVYWHEGYYTAHTGGWHCDIVMYTEYDD